MIKIKQKAFTLSEVLITLAVVGTLAALVVPGLIKDYNSKANMTMLQNTVANLTTAVQAQLTKTGVQDINGTIITKDPEQFFRTLDVVNASSDNKYFPDLNSYKTLDGEALTAIPKSCSASAKLKNGVALCMSDGFSGYDEPTVIFIDLNGEKEPNVSGVDLYGVHIFQKTDFQTNWVVKHAGDVGGYRTDASGGAWCTCYSNDDSSPVACYSQAEQSGFDPNYWKDQSDCSGGGGAGRGES